MERTVEPELMESEDQVDSYAKADFSEGENNLCLLYTSDAADE